MAKGTSGARKFVIGSVVNIAIIGGIILGAGYAAKKLNLGSALVSNIQGAGNVAGQSLLAPISGLISGVTTGTQGLAGSLGNAQESLFHQLGVSQDQLNKFLHPDWYTASGCYSTTNPNYGKGESTLCTMSNSLTTTSGTTDANGLATQNTGSTGVTTVLDRTTGRSTATTQTQPGSNLQTITPGLTSLNAVAQIFNTVGTNPNLSQPNNVGIKAAYNSIVSLFNTTQASQATGQPIVGNYIVPGGTVEPLTQNAIDYYNKIGVRIQRV